MYQRMTLEQVEQLIGQLALQELVQLLKYISERLSHALPLVTDDNQEKERIRQLRLRLANELLAEVENIEDDAQGETDAAEIVRRLRDERIAQICRKDA